MSLSSDTLKNIIIGVLVALGVLAIAAAIWGWYDPAPAPSHDYRPVQVPKIVEHIKRVPVPGPREIITIEKAAVIKRAGLPESLAADPAKQVLAMADIPCPTGNETVAAVMNTTTGQTEMITRKERPAFAALLNQKEIGVRGGYRVNAGDQSTGLVGTAYGRWTFARVGAVHTTAYVEISTTEAADITANAMIEVAYRW